MTMFIPPIMESESVSGYEIRRALIGQRRSLATDVQETLGVARLRFGSLPGNLAMFEVETGGILGDVRELIDLHTPIPVQMHLTMTREQREQLLGRIIAGARSDRILRYSALGKGIYRTHWACAYCQACARADEAEAGFPYWRIQWLYAGIAACPIHRLSLTLGCGHCASSQPFNDRLRLPSIECNCGKLAKPLVEDRSPELNTHIRLATLLMSAQRTKRFFADECNLGMLFRQKARDLGYRKGPLIDRVSLMKVFIRQYGERLLENLGLIGLRNTPTFVECLSEGERPKDVLRFAFLVDFLFGEFASFSNAVTAFASTGEERKQPGSAPRGRRYSQERLAAAAESVRSYVEANPNTTRTELLKRRRYDACYLMLHSRKTYEEIVPESRRRSGYRESRPLRMSQLDAALVLHVKARTEVLKFSSEANLRPLTVRALLLGHPSERIFFDT